MTIVQDRLAPTDPTTDARVKGLVWQDAADHRNSYEFQPLDTLSDLTTPSAQEALQGFYEIVMAVGRQVVGLLSFTSVDSLTAADNVSFVCQSPREAIDFAGMGEALADHASSMGVDLGDIVAGASQHFTESGPRPRRAPLSDEELRALLADDARSMDD